MTYNKITLMFALLFSISLSSGAYAQEWQNPGIIESVGSEFGQDTGDFGPRFVLLDWGQYEKNEYYLSFTVDDEYSTPNGVFGPDSAIIFFESIGKAQEEFELYAENAALVGFGVSVAEVGEDARLITAENGAKLIFREKDVFTVLALYGYLEESDIEDLVSIGEIADETIKDVTN